MSPNLMNKQIKWKTIKTGVEIVSSKAMGKFKFTLDTFRAKNPAGTKLITVGNQIITISFRQRSIT